MAVFNSENYLNPISDENPCGINLENDLTFSELENAAKFSEERQMGGVIVPAAEPDWQKVKDLALALLGKSRDIQVALHLCCALLRLEGLQGFADGLALVQGLLERYWDEVYPRKDEEDDYPIFRVNLLNVLKDRPKVLDALGKAKLTEAKIGQFSWYEVLVAQGRMSAPNKTVSPPDLKLIEAAFQETALPLIQANKASIQQISSRVKAIAKVVNDQSDAEVAPDFSPLLSLLTDMDGFLDEQLGKHPQAESGAEKATFQTQAVAALAAGEFKAGAIQSREDVVKALDAICCYFERCEPSSPIPFLLHRARKLTTMNFLDILKDMAPDALNQAETICGTQAKGN